MRESGASKSPSDISLAYFGGVDSARFIASFLIAIYHSRGFYGAEIEGMSTWIGTFVSFFFLLSGFVLSHRYPNLTLGRASFGDYFRYLGSRFSRVMPLATLGTLLSIPCVLHSFDWGVLGLNIFLLHTWTSDPRVYFAFNAPSWTLCPELLMYLLFPVVLSLARWPFRLILGSLIFGYASSWLVYQSHPAALGWSCLMFPPSRLADFAIGASLYQLVRQKHGAGRKVGNRGWEVLLCFSLVLGFGALELVQREVKISGIAYSSANPGFQLFYLGSRIVPLWIYSLLLVALSLGRGPLRRILENRGMVLLGGLSAPVYLLHFPILLIWKNGDFEFMKENPTFAVSMYLLSVLIISILVHLFYEEPSRRWLNSKMVKGSLQRQGPNLRNSEWFLKPLVGTLGVSVVLSTLLVVSVRSFSVFATELVPVTSLGEEAKDIQFENFVTLSRVGIKRRRDGGMSLRTFWRASEETKSSVLAVHLLDSNGNIVRQFDHPLTAAAKKVGTEWEDTTELPSTEIAGATKIGLAVVHEERTLRADKGERDWGTHRLLLSVQAPKKSESPVEK